MSNPFTFQNSLYDAVTVPDSGILSKPIDSDEFARVTLFGIAAGEELTEHTTPRQAFVHFLEGEGEISLGNEQHPVQAGTWVRMSPSVPHSIRAATPMKMLLIVLSKSL